MSQVKIQTIIFARRKEKKSFLHWFVGKCSTLWGCAPSSVPSQLTLTHLDPYPYLHCSQDETIYRTSFFILHSSEWTSVRDPTRLLLHHEILTCFCKDYCTGYWFQMRTRSTRVHLWREAVLTSFSDGLTRHQLIELLLGLSKFYIWWEHIKSKQLSADLMPFQHL